MQFERIDPLESKLHKATVVKFHISVIQIRQVLFALGFEPDGISIGVSTQSSLVALVEKRNSPRTTR